MQALYTVLRVNQQKSSDQSPQISATFGSRWANKVKINAYYKTMKVFFDLAYL